MEKGCAGEKRRFGKLVQAVMHKQGHLANSEVDCIIFRVVCLLHVGHTHEDSSGLLAVLGAGWLKTCHWLRLVSDGPIRSEKARQSLTKAALLVVTWY